MNPLETRADDFPPEYTQAGVEIATLPFKTISGFAFECDLDEGESLNAIALSDKLNPRDREKVIKAGFHAFENNLLETMALRIGEKSLDVRGAVLRILKKEDKA